MYFIQVFVCFSILSFFIAHNAMSIHCNYKPSNSPQLMIHINRSSVHIPCIMKETKDATITFKQQDTVVLECARVLGNGDNITLNKMVLLQWKLEQFDHDLVGTNQIHILGGNSSIKLTLDRYDDDLIARCFSNGTEMYNNIFVKFKYKEEENDTGLKEDIKNVNLTTEGNMLRNEFANSIILYNTSDGEERGERNSRVILPNHNIFHSISLEDNGTIYERWANESFDLEKKQTIMVKTKWVVYVETNSGGHSLFLLGIVGISCIVIAIILVVCGIYCRKKNENTIENPYAEVYEVAHVQPNQCQVKHPNPTPEEGDYAQIQSQNDRVVYAEIDIRKADKSTPMQDREPYAKIIGVIRPGQSGQNVKMFKG